MGAKWGWLEVSRELNDFIAEEAAKLGYTLLEVSFKGRSGLSVEITLDKNGGITLEECSAFNRSVSSWLDTTTDRAKSYTVDVLSPGLDRVLKSDADLTWAVGRKVRVNVSSGDNAGNLYEGKLKSFNDGKVVITQANGEDRSIEKRDIIKAQLTPEI